MRYIALTATGPVDIGEFPDQDTAEESAAAQFGEDLQAVMLQQNDSVTVTADVPLSAGAIIGGLFVAAYLFSTHRRKKR